MIRHLRRLWRRWVHSLGLGILLGIILTGRRRPPVDHQDGVDPFLRRCFEKALQHYDPKARFR